MVNVPFIWDLNVLSSLFIIGTLSLKELLFLSLFNAFHTSVIFVCAFIYSSDYYWPAARGPSHIATGRASSTLTELE